MEAREGEPAGESNAELYFTGVHAAGDIVAHAMEHGAKVLLGAQALKTFGMAAVGAMIELVFTGYGLVWTKPVEQTELPAFGQMVARILSSRGIFSCAIYMGAAADPSAVGESSA